MRVEQSACDTPHRLGAQLPVRFHQLAQLLLDECPRLVLLAAHELCIGIAEVAEQLELLVVKPRKGLVDRLEFGVQAAEVPHRKVASVHGIRNCKDRPRPPQKGEVEESIRADAEILAKSETGLLEQ